MPLTLLFYNILMAFVNCDLLIVLHVWVRKNIKRNIYKKKRDNTQHTHPLKFFNLVIVHTLDFWYMIKNKEATDSAALEFCHILNKFAAQLDECLSFKDFGLRQNSRASFRRKLGESAICSKCEQNSTAAFSVAYLFFIIYWKTTVGQLTNLKFTVNYQLILP